MIKQASNYVDKLAKLYPELSKSEIKKIIEYGWRMFYFYNLRNCDIVITRPGKLWLLCGYLTQDSVEHYHYYRMRLMRKIRVMFKKRKKEWDGYYYTAITEDEYEKIKKKFGRPVTTLQINNRVLFQIKNEAFVFYDGWKYFIRCKMPINYGYTVYKELYKCKNVKLILIRDHILTLKDLIKINKDEERNH